MSKRRLTPEREKQIRVWAGDGGWSEGSNAVVDVLEELEAVRELHNKTIDRVVELERIAVDNDREIQAARAQKSMCDACAGEGKALNGGPCMCGGSGRAEDAVCYLREALMKSELRVLELEQSIEAEARRTAT